MTRNDKVPKPMDVEALAATEEETLESDISSTQKVKRTRNKKLVFGVGAVVLVAVLVLAGAGFSVWHEQPGFCNTFCHQPMDAYVDGYQNDGTKFLATHKEQAVNCIDCHDPGINEQINEAVIWAKGDYEMDENKHMLATVGVRADAKQCATPECHNFDEVIAVTENWGGEMGVNPHRSHQGTAIDCSNCHSSHETSYMFCNTCHEYDLPEGWSEPVKADGALR